MKVQSKVQNKKQEDIPEFYSGPTFVIKIQYCRDASWQGTIQWLEAKQEQKFRSALELIMLMEESAKESRTGQQGTELRTWRISAKTKGDPLQEFSEAN